MTTSPLYGDAPPSHGEPEGPIAERVHHLENEVADLRDTISRFAELVLGEVKSLRQTPGESAVSPAALGALTAHVEPASRPPSAEPSRRPWLLGEMIRDFGATFRMYLDPRYRVRRATQLMVPLILAIFVGNYILFQYVFAIPLLSTVLEKLGDIVLAILLYKVITREIHRYRQALAQLMAWQEYQAHPATYVVNGEPPSTRLETD